MSKFFAYLEDFHEITIIVPLKTERERNHHFELRGNDEIIPLEILSHQIIGDEHKYVTRFDGYVLLNKLYHVYDEKKRNAELYTGKIVRTELFDDIYYYDGHDLGHTYRKDYTTFKLWTPIAKSIELILVSPENETTTHVLKYTNQGVWELTLEGDFEGYRYRYSSYVNGKTHKFTDPYGISSDANGNYNYVINPKKLYKMTHDRPSFSGKLNEAIIYEVSIRDLTSDPAIQAKNPRTYKGFVEPSLKTPAGNPAGLDYLTSLGVTHLQILPFYDFEGVDELNPDKSYNWGYNPSQYNVPEGSYSKDPNDPYKRLNELKKMIDILHKNKLRVVMDVVYNHVYNVKTFPFDKLIPGYAYRVDSQGILTNSSGCDNDLATERAMIRKFISDSVLYWAKHYNIDGFRFDLMGLIDLKTMNMIRQKLELLRPDIIVYGEGWQMGSPLPARSMAHMYNKNVLYNIGFFNDKIREHIKGATFNPKQKGYALGNNDHLGIIKHLMLGSVLNKFLFKYPSQSINYVECHDNHTFFDKAKLALEDSDIETRKKYQKLATSIILLSQGVPFIHMGQEFYRTKKGVENSYKSPDSINFIDWSLVDEHQEDIDDFRRLVFLRKNLKCLKLPTTSSIKENAYVSCNDYGTCVLEVCREDKHTIVIFKNNTVKENLGFDEPFTILYSSLKQEGDSIKELILNDISTTILIKNSKEAKL